MLGTEQFKSTRTRSGRNRWKSLTVPSFYNRRNRTDLFDRWRFKLWATGRGLLARRYGWDRKASASTYMRHFYSITKELSKWLQFVNNNTNTFYLFVNHCLNRFFMPDPACAWPLSDLSSVLDSTGTGHSAGIEQRTEKYRSVMQPFVVRAAIVPARFTIPFSSNGHPGRLALLLHI